MSRHTYEEKLWLVSQVKRGKPIKQLSREVPVAERMLLEWVRKHELYGDEGLKKQRNIRASPEQKAEMVRLITEEHVLLPQVVLEYGVSRSALESWVRQVRRQGYGALEQEKRRGRPPDTMGRAKKHNPETELEKLQAENARLRAENALLKKVTALVREREALERMSGQKPSKN